MTLQRTLASMMQRFRVALINYAESDFDQGDTLPKLAKLSAVAADQEALKRNPDFGAAKANLIGAET